jgi:hypothetical protein
MATMPLRVDPRDLTHNCAFSPDPAHASYRRPADRPGRSRTGLTPQQKRFNSLIRQIQQARRALARWHDSIPVYGQAYTQVLLPLQTAFIAARREWAFALDVQLERRRWTKTEP